MTVLRRLLQLIVLLLVLALAAVGWAWWQVGRSLPQQDGAVALAGLSAEVVIERDALGVPTLRAASRIDLARALGFVHAQERFFQMDLARRRAAGELSELFGRAAVSTDRPARLHRFRARAGVVLAAETPENRAAIVAYADGVNAGLAALGARPFEYLLLRQEPRPWVPEDSLLVVASMFFNLQDAQAAGDARAGALYEALPEALADFLNSSVSQWETPELGEPRPLLVPPTAVEAGQVGDAGGMGAGGAGGVSSAGGTGVEETPVGSNNWAVAGSRTADGHAILANDMHLGLGVPNIWYRASLVRPHAGRELRVTGATLPGVPGMIVGSNGTIAWGFTNTTADWSDRIILTVRGEGSSAEYLTPEGWRRFEVTSESIAVADEDAEAFEVRETIWGPVDGPDARGRLHAIAWVAHSPEGLNLRWSAMDEVASLEEAMDLANRSGVPAQNCTMADNQGRIAWTVAGRIPRRVGFSGVRPVSFADGTARWDGWYEPADYPRILNPDSGVIVTANNRIVSGTFLEMMGDGGYDPGARAGLIKEGLLGKQGLTYADMMRVHLDDRAVLLDQWRGLALKALATTELTGPRAEFKRLIEDTWTGHASVDSAGYRLVRQFRMRAAELAWAPFVARMREVAPNVAALPGRSIEGPVWSLLTNQPAHLLDPAYASWNDLLLAAIDRVIAELTTDGRQLAERTWGEANTLMAQHPISRAVPSVSRWLDLPKTPLPGDSHMPRFQSSTNGASERMAVSPGHEEDGYFHMPGGQSGHPRSPHFQDGHAAWVEGTPTPFLPGPTVSTLRLVVK
jgi:penicillin amidase